MSQQLTNCRWEGRRRGTRKRKKIKQERMRHHKRKNKTKVNLLHLPFCKQLSILPDHWKKNLCLSTIDPRTIIYPGKWCSKSACGKSHSNFYPLITYAHTGWKRKIYWHKCWGLLFVNLIKNDRRLSMVAFLVQVTWWFLAFLFALDCEENKGTTDIYLTGSPLSTSIW